VAKTVFSRQNESVSAQILHLLSLVFASRTIEKLKARTNHVKESERSLIYFV